MNYKILGGVLIVVLLFVITWQVKKDSEKVYPTDDIGVEFTYPEYYFYEEREEEDGSRVVVLTEDTEESRALREGTTTPAREGPVAITIQRFENPDELTAEEWVKSNAQRSNFSVSSGVFTEIEVDGEPGERYAWSGLYEGNSVAVAREKDLFLFTVTFLTYEDKIREDFEALLKSVSFK